MKHVIAGVLLLVGMSVDPALASDRALRHDIRHDERQIARDHRELQRDLYHGNYAAARHERREIRRRERDLDRDRRDLYWDRQ